VVDAFAGPPAACELFAECRAATYVWFDDERRAFLSNGSRIRRAQVREVFLFQRIGKRDLTFKENTIFRLPVS
jgi:hypothetical protein